MADNSFEEVGFTTEGGLKDANHIRRLAMEAQTSVPIIDVAHRREFHFISFPFIHRAMRADACDWVCVDLVASLANGGKVRFIHVSLHYAHCCTNRKSKR